MTLEEKTFSILKMKRGYDHTAHDVSKAYYDLYNENIIWHAFTGILQHLAYTGHVLFTGYDINRQCLYRYVGGE